MFHAIAACADVQNEHLRKTYSSVHIFNIHHVHNKSIMHVLYINLAVVLIHGAQA